jgi:LysM repeat protein
MAALTPPLVLAGASATPTADTALLIVRAGESLADVARRAGIPLDTLIAANNLRSPGGTLRPVYAGET